MDRVVMIKSGKSIKRSFFLKRYFALFLNDRSIYHCLQPFARANCRTDRHCGNRHCGSLDKDPKPHGDGNAHAGPLLPPPTATPTKTPTVTSTSTPAPIGLGNATRRQVQVAFESMGLDSAPVGNQRWATFDNRPIRPKYTWKRKLPFLVTLTGPEDNIKEAFVGVVLPLKGPANAQSDIALYMNRTA